MEGATWGDIIQAVGGIGGSALVAWFGAKWGAKAAMKAERLRRLGELRAVLVKAAGVMNDMLTYSRDYVMPVEWKGWLFEADEAAVILELEFDEAVFA